MLTEISRLIADLGYKLDFQMYNSYMCRAEINELESAFFLNKGDSIVCWVIRACEGAKKIFAINNFTNKSQSEILTEYKQLAENTQWRYI